MSRYPPLLIALHWISALLIFAAFLLGIFGLAEQPNTPAKLLPLGAHIALGTLTLVLTVLRFLVRWFTVKPLRRPRNPSARPRPLIVTMAEPVQYLLYLFTFLMSLTGIGLTVQAGVLTPAGLILPEDFYAFPLRVVHGTLSTALFVLISLHLLTWAYFQFLRGENALAWMWFRGKKKG